MNQEEYEMISAGMQGCLTEIEKALDVFESGTPSAAYAMLPPDLKPYVLPDEVVQMAGVAYDATISVHDAVQLFSRVISLALDRQIEAEGLAFPDFSDEVDVSSDSDSDDFGNEVW